MEVLQYLIQNCANQAVYATHGCSSDNSILHATNAEIGKFACAAGRRAVMNSKNRNVFWTEQKFGEVQSIVGCVRVFSDKSQISPAARCMKFYSLHIILLNFIEELKRHCILSETSIVEYLPIFFEDPCSSRMKDTLHGKKN